MNQSQQIITALNEATADADIRVGDKVKVDLKHPDVKERSAAAPPWMRLLQKEIKNGGGFLAVRGIRNGSAEAYAWDTSSWLLGTVSVPLSALTKVGGKTENYRKQVVVHNGDYKITSYGNGAAYVIERKRDGRSTMLQGDDAVQFDKDMEAAEEHDRDLDDLAADYDEVLEQHHSERWAGAPTKKWPAPYASPEKIRAARAFRASLRKKKKHT